MTHVLITNDDGIHAPGLCEIARIALALGLDATSSPPCTPSSGPPKNSTRTSIGHLLRYSKGRWSFSPTTTTAC